MNFSEMYACSCFSSPIQRARNFADLVWADREGPLVPMDSLREAHLGWLQGMSQGRVLLTQRVFKGFPLHCLMLFASLAASVQFCPTGKGLPFARQELVVRMRRASMYRLCDLVTLERMLLKAGKGLTCEAVGRIFTRSPCEDSVSEMSFGAGGALLLMKCWTSGVPWRLICGQA